LQLSLQAASPETFGYNLENPTLAANRLNVQEITSWEKQIKIKETTSDNGTKKEENTKCMFWDQIFSESNAGEEWSKCSSCNTWSYTYEKETGRRVCL
jgi:hypothetical protein